MALSKSFWSILLKILQFILSLLEKSGDDIKAKAAKEAVKFYDGKTFKVTNDIIKPCGD